MEPFIQVQKDNRLLVIDEELTFRKQANPKLNENELPIDHEEEDDMDLLELLKDHNNGATTVNSGLQERAMLLPSGEIFNLFPAFTSKDQLDGKVELIEVVEAFL